MAKRKKGKVFRERLSRSSRASSAPRAVLAHYPRYNERWSEREDRLLIALREKLGRRLGEPSAIYEVAQRLGRTPTAVQTRINTLGIRSRRVRP